MVDTLFMMLSIYDIAYIVIACGVFAALLHEAIGDAGGDDIVIMLLLSAIWPLTLSVFLFMFLIGAFKGYIERREERKNKK